MGIYDDDYNPYDHGDGDWDDEGEECEYAFLVEDEDLIDGVGFADPSGVSSLRAATRANPRNLPCPTCRVPNRLTPLDKRQGYQCNECADKAEGGWGY